MNRCLYCEAELIGKRPQALYCDSLCRTAGWREQHPKTVHTPPRTVSQGSRRGGPSGLQISYRKAVNHLAEQLARHQVVDPPDKAVLVAELWLRDVLSDRQRSRLAARR